MNLRIYPIFRCLLPVCLYFLLPSAALAQHTALPVPKDSRERLFYLQRDPNSNTIIYDMNYLPDGSIDTDDPVEVYWIKYAKGGMLENLSLLEKKYAYGVKTELADAANGVYKLNLVAYKKIDILLQKAPDKNYHAFVSINGKTMILNKVFLRINGGSKMKPNIEYIEFTGKDHKTGLAMVERVKP